MTIILYSNNCPRCKLLKEMLDAKGFQYIISIDFRYCIVNGFRSAPVLEVDGLMLGYDEAVIYIKGDRI